MNIVASGSKYQIYGDAVKTYKELPVGSYNVNFNKFTGFYLTPRQDLEAREEKIYGNHQRRINKVLGSFEKAERNFGVILSGAKGIGKSLFARLLAENCIQRGLPIITVTEYIPGIADFLSSIEQTVVVIFDEFEKTFGKNDNGDPQNEMLSLFDGLDTGKKLFVVTCNRVHQLNEYLINRPGRFHYHFTITNPNPEEVREYMTDKLDPEYHGVIEKVVNFSMTADVTYDYLRALAFELNQGYTLEETLSDLNITRGEDAEYNITVTFADGAKYKRFNYRLDIYDKDFEHMRVYDINSGDDDDDVEVEIRFNTADIRIVNGALTLDPAKVKAKFEKYYTSREDKAAFKKANDGRVISNITFTKCQKQTVYRYDGLL